MRRPAFEKFAWFFVAYLLAVILFGAWVRITHSGAGCGSHWPTCGGEVIPAAASAETRIEFTHRVTSGLCGLFGLILLGWAWRLGRSGPLFRWSALALLFIVVEALLGAGLVLGELVGDNDSVARAVVISLHLVNTLILMSCAAVTAWLAGGKRFPDLASYERAALAPFAIGLFGLVLVSMSGAITALGDTLFPMDPALGPGLFAKIRGDLSPANHFLVRLRILHPILAILVSAYLLWLLLPLARLEPRRGWARLTLAGIGLELGLGALNVALAAPGWLQLVHLLAAHLVWIGLLLTSVEEVTRAAPASDRAPAPAAVG